MLVQKQVIRLPGAQNQGTAAMGRKELEGLKRSISQGGMWVHGSSRVRIHELHTENMFMLLYVNYVSSMKFI